MFLEEVWKEIRPCGIASFNELDFLLAGSVFQCGLARDGAANVAKVFEIDQAMDVVVAGVGGVHAFSVRCDAADEVIGHAYVEVSRAA